MAEPRRWLILIFGLGVILRMWGIGFGLPYQFHQDEPIIINHALAYGTGDLNPHFFIIPPLASYVLFAAYTAYFLSLKTLMIVRGAEDFAVLFFRDPTSFYLIGRYILGLLPSAINVLLTYRVARRFFSMKAALYASAVMSVTFLNVINGHYAYTDNLLVMFTLLSYDAMSGLVESPSRKSYITSAIFIGIAIATKYNAAILLGAFLAAVVISVNKISVRAQIFNLTVFAAIVVISFFICNPFSVFDFRFFFNSLTGKIMHGYMGPWHHIAHSLFEGFGGLLILFGMMGLALFFRADIKKALFLSSFPALFYIHLIFASQPYSRYVLTLVPFLSIGAGYLIFDLIFPRLKSKAAVFVLVTASIVLIVPTCVKSIKADIIFSQRDTRTEAVEWICKNIPSNSKIVLDHTFFGPPIKQNIRQLREKEAITNKQPELASLKSRKLDIQIRAADGGSAYEVFYMADEGEKAGQFLNFWPVISSDTADMRKAGIEYIVLSNMSSIKTTRRLEKELMAGAKQLIAFSPYIDNEVRPSLDGIELTNIPVKSDELFSRARPGPCLTVYRLR